MRTLKELLLKLPARSIRDLIARNQGSSHNAAYKIMCCTGTLNDDDFKQINKDPAKIPCSDTCRVLFLNNRSREKNPPRQQCGECLNHIRYVGYTPLINEPVENELKVEVQAKLPTFKPKYSRKSVKNENS